MWGVCLYMKNARLYSIARSWMERWTHNFSKTTKRWKNEFDGRGSKTTFFYFCAPWRWLSMYKFTMYKFDVQIYMYIVHIKPPSHNHSVMHKAFSQHHLLIYVQCTLNVLSTWSGSMMILLIWNWQGQRSKACWQKWMRREELLLRKNVNFDYQHMLQS